MEGPRARNFEILRIPIVANTQGPTGVTLTAKRSEQQSVARNHPLETPPRDGPGAKLHGAEAVALTAHTWGPEAPGSSGNQGCHKTA